MAETEFAIQFRLNAGPLLRLGRIRMKWKNKNCIQ